jgi:hypothetical protein
MSTKQFKDLNVDDQFELAGVSYKKIEEKRVSCCRSINACAVANPEHKIQVKPLDEVSVNDEQK